MKYVVIDFHFIHDQVQNGALCFAFISFQDHLANIFMKPLSLAHFVSLLITNLFPFINNLLTVN